MTGPAQLCSEALTSTAWHWARTADGKPVLRDGREIIIGEWLRHEGDIEICRAGLHVSRTALHALKYAPGPFVTFCEISEIAGEQPGDKLVCRARKPLWGYDATEVLSAFVRRVALDVSHLWDVPPVVRQYLETGSEDLRDAARDAAGCVRQSDFGLVLGRAGLGVDFHCVAGWLGAWGAVWSAVLAVVSATGAVHGAVWYKYERWLEEMLIAGRPPRGLCDA